MAGLSADDLIKSLQALAGQGNVRAQQQLERIQKVRDEETSKITDSVEEMKDELKETVTKVGERIRHAVQPKSDIDTTQADKYINGFRDSIQRLDRFKNLSGWVNPNGILGRAGERSKARYDYVQAAREMGSNKSAAELRDEWKFINEQRGIMARTQDKMKMLKGLGYSDAQVDAKYTPILQSAQSAIFERNPMLSESSPEELANEQNQVLKKQQEVLDRIEKNTRPLVDAEKLLGKEKEDDSGSTSSALPGIVASTIMAGGAGAAAGGAAAGGILKRTASTILSKGKALARFAGRAALPLAVGLTAWDAVSGWNKAGPNATTGEKAVSAASEVASGLTFGLVDSKTIAEGLSSWFGMSGTEKPALEIAPTGKFAERVYGLSEETSKVKREEDNPPPVINAPQTTIKTDNHYTVRTNARNTESSWQMYNRMRYEAAGY